MRITRSIQALAFLTLFTACEGEPPKTPTGATQAPAVAGPEASAEADDSAVAPPAHPAVAAPASSCGCCPCTAAVDAGAGGAEATAVSPPAVVLPAATSLSITGLVISMGKPQPFAVVYLEDAPIEPTAKMTALIDNKTMAFMPFVTVIPVGGKVTFKNDDPFPHNVFSPDAEKFNMGTISQHQAMIHGFPKAGAYTLLCNLHPGMLGYLIVAPSSYFAKTDAKGHYTIKAVPPGTYKATAWAARLPTVTQPVVVKSGDATLDFDLHR